MRKNQLSTLLAVCIFSIVSYGQKNKATTDYLNVPGPIAFDQKSYNLSWTSHPADNFYKQEYLTKGDNADRFISMVLLDVITGDVNIRDIVASKVAELKKLKETNPVINYETLDNPKTGQYMIDFLISENAPNGGPGIVERNVYRYQTFADKLGHKGVVLFGISTRSYGGDINKFFASLKLTRNGLINKISKYPIPEIIIKK